VVRNGGTSLWDINWKGLLSSTHKWKQSAVEVSQSAQPVYHHFIEKRCLQHLPPENYRKDSLLFGGNIFMILDK
jgi:hypothetical protein